MTQAPKGQGSRIFGMGDKVTIDGDVVWGKFAEGGIFAIDKGVAFWAQTVIIRSNS